MKQWPLSLVTLLLFVGAIAALGQNLQRSPQEVIVVMALSVSPDATPQQIQDRARAFTSQLRKQPGALDDTILKSTIPTAQPQYVLVMRWRQREDWEAMLANPDLWGTLEKSARPFKLERAAYFTQLD
ncbi:MAG TPA: antibiotic biosynthesis monooxygenase [Steroidobacteraceae bacterium]|jgi:hypothetical protein|nr:antibiotic biosynthesis monooxygenase [Steroidobacteraceae bacterium]